MITVVYAHPQENSLAASVRTAIEKQCKNKNIEYNMIDLYKDGFNPVLNEKEREQFFNGGVSQDTLVKQYQNFLLKTDRLVFIFPIWWNEQPAIVKGFIERVCLPNFAFKYTQHGLAPLLTNIKEVDVFTSSGAPTEAITKYSGNIIQNQFIQNIILPLTGLENANWINIGLSNATQEILSNHLTEVSKLF